MRPRSRGGKFQWWILAALLVWLGVRPTQVVADPAPFAFTLESSVTGGCHFDAPSRTAAGSMTAVSATALGRFPLASPGWSTTVGVQVERYAFTAGPVSRLQDIAATFGIEYRRDGKRAATVVAHPGLYFGARTNAAAGDVPIDAITGVPIGHGLNGVIGLSTARFYHHPLPIFGLVWDASPRLHVQLVYPEPSIEYTVDRQTLVRVGGELIGGGFLVDLPAKSRTPVEFSSYRVGVGVTRTFPSRVELTVSAGIEAFRSFDAFSVSRRDHGSGGAYIAIQLSSRDE